jgi:hypothetical protein
MDEEALEHLRAMMPGKLTLEIDLYMMVSRCRKTKRKTVFSVHADAGRS